MTPGLADACVVIPTFNEVANIAKLVSALRALSPGLRVIVVDDGSPDGTGPAVAALAAKDPQVELIQRSGKGGRGSACLAGFKSALTRPETKVFVEMDADFSHDPSELAATIVALEGADVVIRSRYLPGSAIIDWTLARRVFSRLSNFFARAVLGIPLADYTNGYRAYRRTSVEAIEFDRIQNTGYIVLSEVAYQLHLKGLRFAELPTVFVNRRRGESNLSLSEILGALRGVLSLRAKYRA